MTAFYIEDDGKEAALPVQGQSDASPLWSPLAASRRFLQVLQLRFSVPLPPQAICYHGLLSYTEHHNPETESDIFNHCVPNYHGTHGGTSWHTA